MRKLLLAALVAIFLPGLALAQTPLTPPSINWGGTVTRAGPSQIVVQDSITGLPCIWGTAATCGVFPAGGGGGGGGAVTIASGADVVEGALADTTCTALSHTVNGCLYVLGQTALGPTPAQGSHGVNIGGVEGVSATAAGASENPLLGGCRASTTPPTAVTDGQKVPAMCSPEGKAIVAFFAPNTMRRWGSASTATTTPQAFTGWTLPTATAYITDVTCHREDTGTTPLHATLNDSASTVIPLPAGGGFTHSYLSPLKTTAAATIPTFTLSGAVSGGSVYCSGEGYEN